MTDRARLARGAGRRWRALVGLTVMAAVVAACRPTSPTHTALVRVPGTTTIPTTTVPTTTAPPPPPTTVPPPPPTTAGLQAPVPAPSPAVTAAAAPSSGLTPYVGLGTWVDVYDWSRTYGRGPTLVGPADVNRMAAVGVQTLYLQAGKWDAPADVLDPDLLLPIVGRAHEHGIRVVAWYLPTLVDPGADLRRLLAIAALDVDGLAVDIEARDVPDVTERNRRLVELSTALRQALPGRAIGAIALPPVQLEELNPRYWSPFPYGELAPLYDVWLTMGYWTFRTPQSGWRDAYRYTFENGARLRRNLGRPDVPVHPIGGIGHRTTVGDVQGFVRAAYDLHALGGSLYDWRTTPAELWPVQQPFRGR